MTNFQFCMLVLVILAAPHVRSENVNTAMFVTLALFAIVGLAGLWRDSLKRKASREVSEQNGA